MDFKTYVQSVVAAYVEKQDQNVIFIKHYNTLDITQEEILANVEKTDDKVFLYHEYVMHNMHNAFAPFLDWIRWCYNTFYSDLMSVENFLDSCHVYSLHREPIASLIRDGVCRRKEDVMNFEVAFESNRMIQDIISILEYLAKEHHLIMILSKFHLAPFSTLQLLSRIIEKSLNVHVIVMYNDEFRVAAYKKEVWEEILKKSEEMNLQLDWGSMDSKRTIDIPDEFWFDKDKKDEYILKLNNMYYMFALEDAYYYMADIIYRMDEKTIWLTRQEQFPFLQLAAMIDMDMGQVNHALVICDKMTNMCTLGTDDNLTKYMYYYTCARARIILEQSSVVCSYCEKCINLAKEMNDDYLECKAEILLYSSKIGINRDLFEYNSLFNEIDAQLIEKTEKYGFLNFLAYYYVFGFGNEQETVDAVANGEMEPVHFNKGIELGTKLGNDNFLMNAYMKNIILYSRYERYKYVREMYKKRLAVLKRPNPLREAHMYAGLGYNSIVIEDYEKADTYLKKKRQYAYRA